MYKIGTLPILAFIYICFFCFIYSFVHLKYLSSNNYLAGDEGRYLDFANNLIKGFYTNTSDPDLWYGPGFPIYIYIYRILNFTEDVIRHSNLILLLISWLLNASSIKRITQKSLIISLGISSLLLPWVYDAVDFFRIHTETFTYFLISLIVYSFIRGKKNADTHNNKYVYLGFFLLGILSITKVIFIYVLYISILLFSLQNKRRLVNYYKMFLIAILPSLFWLGFTFKISNKFFYPGTSGGLQLYFLTSTLNKNADSYWLSGPDALNSPDSSIFKRITEHNMNQLESDAYLKEQSLQNIKNNPILYAQRVILNSGRLIFYNLSRDSILPTFLAFRHYLLLVSFCFLIFSYIKFNIWADILFWPVGFVLVYLAMSLLVMANFRFFVIIYPTIIYMMFFSFELKSIYLDREVNDTVNFRE
jgi:hypothetical protein